MRDMLCVIVVCLVIFTQAQRIPTGDERQEILDAHNRARRESAQARNISNMVELTWSDAAANHGLSHISNGCPFSHSDYVGAGFGENLALSAASWTAAIYTLWHANEIACYDRFGPDNWEDCESSGSCACEHYTAVNWQQTSVVGCAICDSTNLYICNYGEEAPNDVNERPFEANSGAPCSACPSDKPTCVDSLCTANDADPCDPNPCANGGLCGVSGSGFSCLCPVGWVGDTCDLDATSCDPNPCENGGRCTVVADQFTCACEAGFIGQICEDEGDQCDLVGDECGNNGQCMATTANVEGWVCECDEFFEHPSDIFTCRFGRSNTLILAFDELFDDSGNRDIFLQNLRREIVTLLDIEDERIDSIAVSPTATTTEVFIEIAGLDEAPTGNDDDRSAEDLIVQLMAEDDQPPTIASALEMRCLDCSFSGETEVATIIPSGGMSTGALVGIAVGIVVLILGVVGGVLFYRHRKRRFSVADIDSYGTNEVSPDMSGALEGDTQGDGGVRGGYY